MDLILLKFDFDLLQPYNPPPMMQQPQVPYIPQQNQPPPFQPNQPSPVPAPRGIAGGNLPPGTPPTTALRDHGIKVLSAIVLMISDHTFYSSMVHMCCMI